MNDDDSPAIIALRVLALAALCWLWFNAGKAAGEVENEKAVRRFPRPPHVVNDDLDSLLRRVTALEFEFDVHRRAHALSTPEVSS